MSLCTPLNISGSNFSNQCDYITNVQSCSLSSGFINYYQWQYCAFASRTAPTILMVIWFIILLLWIAIAADSFLAPCLVVVTKTLRMSQNLAGVTLLALGNGAADVFSTLSSVLSDKNPNLGLAFGGTLGAAIIVNTVTAGAIIVIKPFDLMRRPIMKDLGFYFVSLLWCVMIFARRQIELWSSLVFLVIYGLYLVTTVVGRLLYIRKKKKKSNEPIENIQITVTNANDGNADQLSQSNIALRMSTVSESNDYLTENGVKIPQGIRKNACLQNGFDNPGYPAPKYSTHNVVIPNIREISSRKSSHKSSIKSSHSGFDNPVYTPCDEEFSIHHLVVPDARKISSEKSSHSEVDTPPYPVPEYFGHNLTVPDSREISSRKSSHSEVDTPPYPAPEYSAHNLAVPDAREISSRKSSYNGIDDSGYSVPEYNTANLTVPDAREISSRKSSHNGIDNPSYTPELPANNLVIPKLSFVSMTSSLETKSEHSQGHVNRIYHGRQGSGHLHIPHFIPYKNTDRPIRISTSSSIDFRTPKSSVVSMGKRSNESKRRRKTSHRMIGSFAKLIIENEQEKELKKKDLDAQQSKIVIGRSNSLDINKSLPRRIRFYSVDESGRPSVQIHHEIQNALNQTGTNEIFIIESRSIDEDSKESDSEMFPGIFKHFLLTILPVDLEEWKEQSVFNKILSVIQSPLVFILTLTVPVVENGAYLNGWCQILNCAHGFVSPVIAVLLLNLFTVRFGATNFYLIYFMIIVGIIISIIFATTSKPDDIPLYHSLFAFMGLVLSILWIYAVANEIVNLLTIIGVVFSISDTILGLSVLAIANSIGDLVADIALARKNYPRIGYSACLGSPLFNLLIGIGLPFSIKTMQGSIPIQLKSESIILLFTILFITVMNIICIPLMKFRPRKFYGIILICIYFVFFVLAILFATDTIKVTV